MRERLDRVRGETLRWLEALSAEQVAAYGNHPQRGAITVADCIQGIATHDRERAAWLGDLSRAARGVAAAGAGESGDENAVADR